MQRGAVHQQLWSMQSIRCCINRQKSDERDDKRAAEAVSDGRLQNDKDRGRCYALVPARIVTDPSIVLTLST